MESFSGDLPDFTDHIPVERGISHAAYDFSTTPCWGGPLTGDLPGFAGHIPARLRRALPKEHKKGLSNEFGVLFSALSAVRGGFEPPVRLIPYGSLANCWFQPLTHLTRSKPNVVPILKRKCGPLLKRDDKVNLNLPFCQIKLHLFVQD